MAAAQEERGKTVPGCRGERVMRASSGGRPHLRDHRPSFAPHAGLEGCRAVRRSHESLGPSGRSETLRYEATFSSEPACRSFGLVLPYFRGAAASAGTKCQGSSHTWPGASFPAPHLSKSVSLSGGGRLHPEGGSPRRRHGRAVVKGLKELEAHGNEGRAEDLSRSEERRVGKECPV